MTSIISIIIILLIDIVFSLITDSIHIDMSGKEKSNSINALAEKITQKRDLKKHLSVIIFSTIIQFILFYIYISYFLQINEKMYAYLFIFLYSIFSRIYMKKSLYYLIDKNVSIKKDKQKIYYAIKFTLLTIVCYFLTYTILKFLIHQFI